MTNSIAYLLGAGFSAPMGYPIGNELNKRILKSREDVFSFHTSGVLVVSKDGKKPDFGYKNSYEIQFEFCTALVELFYSRNGYFDYEEFYDFMLEEAKTDQHVNEIAKKYVSQFGTVGQLIAGLKNIYPQIVSYYLKDGAGKKWYDDEPHLSRGIFPGYTGFMYHLENTSKDLESVNVHTLNHDLFFESLNNTEWLAGQICDGFEEAGSVYYGKLDVKGRLYHPRLSRYTGVYNRKIKLYKLHGSLDYGVFYKSDGGTMYTPEVYVKTRYGIGFDEMLKEVIHEGKPRYEDCWVNYHADFLTGTTSKIQRYKEPLLYTKLFKLFVENLRMAQSFIMIGYGCRDSEVNRLIVENFDYETKPCYIIDPYAGTAVKEFAEKVRGKIIPTTLENLRSSDFAK
jgi:hypothetical protein